MKVCLIAFASAAEILGERRSVVVLPDGAHVGDLLDAVEARAPGFANLRPRLAVAIDGRLADLADPLSDGAEVAFLPPVSGGNLEPRRRLTSGAIDLGTLLEESSSTDCGAQVVFVGRVRSEVGGPGVNHLHYEAYEPMATEALDRICRELQAADSTIHVEIVHRLGEVPLGEASVVIVTRAPHRAAAYDANRTALERLKREAPIWKLEVYADGSSTWREEEPLDAKHQLGPSSDRSARSS